MYEPNTFIKHIHDKWSQIWRNTKNILVEHIQNKLVEHIQHKLVEHIQNKMVDDIQNKMVEDIQNKMVEDIQKQNSQSLNPGVFFYRKEDCIPKNIY